MIKLIVDGIKAKTFVSTLKLYFLSLLVAGLSAIIIVALFGPSLAFRLAPFIAAAIIVAELLAGKFYTHREAHRNATSTLRSPVGTRSVDNRHVREVKKDPKTRIAAIVPAYNAERTLSDILMALQSNVLLDEVIVVSDGSTDNTVEIARSRGLRTIHLRQNLGKGIAMAVGVAHTNAPILAFVDDNVLNMTAEHLSCLIEPVLSGRSGMNVGLRDRGPALNDWQHRHGPLLSGIRCLRREIFEAVPESHLEGFAIETGLNWACRELGMRATTTILHNINFRVPEKRRGLVRAFRAQMRMLAAVFGAYMVLRFKPPALERRERQIAGLGLEYIDFG